MCSPYSADSCTQTQTQSFTRHYTTQHSLHLVPFVVFTGRWLDQIYTTACFLKLKTACICKSLSPLRPGAYPASCIKSAGTGFNFPSWPWQMSSIGNEQMNGIYKLEHPVIIPVRFNSLKKMLYHPVQLFKPLTSTEQSYSSTRVMHCPNNIKSHLEINFRVFFHFFYKPEMLRKKKQHKYTVYIKGPLVKNPQF